MTTQSRRQAVARATVAAQSAEGWDAALPAARGMLRRMGDMSDAPVEERARLANGLERILIAESASFLKEPVAQELSEVIHAFRDSS